VSEPWCYTGYNINTRLPDKAVRSVTDNEQMTINDFIQCMLDFSKSPSLVDYWHGPGCESQSSGIKCTNVSTLNALISNSPTGKRVHLFWYVTNQPPKANSAFHPSGVSKWVSPSAGKANAGMVHSVSGWTRGVQVKLWDPLRTRVIPERLRGVFTTRCYTNPRLPLPLPSMVLSIICD